MTQLSGTGFDCAIADAAPKSPIINKAQPNRVAVHTLEWVLQLPVDSFDILSPLILNSGLLRSFVGAPAESFPGNVAISTQGLDGKLRANGARRCFTWKCDGVHN